MSIWVPIAGVGHSDYWGDDPDGTVLTYADGWSNHYPDGEVERPAAVGLSAIPPWCVPGHSPDDHDDEADQPGPWLRLHLLTRPSGPRAEGDEPRRITDGATVLLTPDAARALAAELTKWADLDHTKPKEA
ncbi:hypothetical protein [Cellulosimicrobium funkei]|uniref:hypothetical protein n=1 Tax=Cellulosimicrobium funkei TaxID=264251 RepID=UPI00367DC919